MSIALTVLILGIVALAGTIVARVLEDHPLVQAAADWLTARDIL